MHHYAAPSQVCLGPLEASPPMLGPSCNKNPVTAEDCYYAAESDVTNAQGGCGVLGIITRQSLKSLLKFTGIMLVQMQTPTIEGRDQGPPAL